MKDLPGLAMPERRRSRYSKLTDLLSHWDRKPMAVERTRAEMADIISTFLRGECAWVWDDFISVRIKDPSLDAVRAQCAALPQTHPPSIPGRYCNEVGMAVLRSLAESLRRAVV